MDFDTELAVKLLALMCVALWCYFQAVRGDGGKPSDRLRKLIMTEALNAEEIARLETRLTERDPDWRYKL